MTASVTIRLAIAIQRTLGNRSTPDTVNGTAARLSIAERPFSRENVPSDGLSSFSEKLYAVRVLLIF
jgi:hypothetical protein